MIIEKVDGLVEKKNKIIKNKREFFMFRKLNEQLERS